MINEFLNTSFELINSSYPKNIYAIRISDESGNIYDISVSHEGYCPEIKSEREQSNYNDYLSNLENSVINEFFKSINKRKPKVYTNQIEIVTNHKGELFHYSRACNL